MAAPKARVVLGEHLDATAFSDVPLCSSTAKRRRNSSPFFTVTTLGFPRVKALRPKGFATSPP